VSADHIALRSIALGGFCAGLAVFIYPTLRKVAAGGSWMDPWIGVASGLLGPAARDGGVGIAVLGAALHFFICLSGAALLWLLVSRVKLIPRQWFVLGVLYGLAVLVTMNYVILPLSQIGRSIYPLSNMHVTAFWHIVLVGIPTAFFVARGLRQAQT
jgi:hypothetical protein